MSPFVSHQGLQAPHEYIVPATIAEHHKQRRLDPSPQRRRELPSLALEQSIGVQGVGAEPVPVHVHHVRAIPAALSGDCRRA
ncbi:hypothetical protein [Nannocystis sp.]|uniref:hypothetical protein n=1 Tax=Nannocystis sp. TaxID=1962667 RepID=UPI0025E71F8F|nr:hypothetical protein [Nannocystis sp.]MBK7826340.1 hypothetical protein [Nannocystis sp.]